MSLMGSGSQLRKSPLAMSRSALRNMSIRVWGLGFGLRLRVRECLGKHVHQVNVRAADVKIEELVFVAQDGDCAHLPPDAEDEFAAIPAEVWAERVGAVRIESSQACPGSEKRQMFIGSRVHFTVLVSVVRVPFLVWLCLGLGIGRQIIKPTCPHKGADCKLKPFKLMHCS